jgi:hypothetical protein
MGRSTGGGMIELNVKNLSSFLIIDVDRLPRGDAKRLASSLTNLSLRLGSLIVLIQLRTSMVSS